MSESGRALVAFAAPGLRVGGAERLGQEEKRRHAIRGTDERIGTVRVMRATRLWLWAWFLRAMRARLIFLYFLGLGMGGNTYRRPGRNFVDRGSACARTVA